MMNGGSGRGAFILFEGVDRCGKSTQSRLLTKFLSASNRSVESMAFPNRTTPIGKIINSYLSQSTEMNDEAMHLLFSANRWEMKDAIVEKLSKGIDLVVDRYAYSGVAFTSAKGLDIDWCKAPDIGLPSPDIVFYLSLPPEKAIERGGYGEERYETVHMQDRVRQSFAKLKSEHWTVLDASLSVEELHEHIKAHLRQVLPSIREQPISYNLF